MIFSYLSHQKTIYPRRRTVRTNQTYITVDNSVLIINKIQIPNCSMLWYCLYHTKVLGVPPGGSLRTTLWYKPYHPVVASKAERFKRKRSCNSFRTARPFMFCRMRFLQTYFLFFQSLVISSRVLPFVSGTSFHTKIAATTQIIP